MADPKAVNNLKDCNSQDQENSRTLKELENFINDSKIHLYLHASNSQAGQMHFIPPDILMIAFKEFIESGRYVLTEHKELGCVSQIKVTTDEDYDQGWNLLREEDFHLLKALYNDETYWNWRCFYTSKDDLAELIKHWADDYEMEAQPSI